MDKQTLSNVADLLEKGVHHNGTTQVIVDASKF